LTPVLEQHIRQLDLAHMLGGCNLFSEAVERSPSSHNHSYDSRRLSALALTCYAPGAAPRRASPNHIKAHRDITFNRRPIAYKPLRRPLLLEHAYAYHRERHTTRTPDRTHHSRPIISRLRSGQHLWNRHGDFSMRSRSSELEGGYTNGIHGFF